MYTHIAHTLKLQDPLRVRKHNLVFHPLRAILSTDPVNAMIDLLGAGPDRIDHIGSVQWGEERVVRAEHDAVRTHVFDQALQGCRVVGDGVEVHALKVARRVGLKLVAHR